FWAAAGTKTPGQKIWFYSIRVPKDGKAPPPSNENHHKTAQP
ncbi:MAG: hypothetical protein ACJA0J_001741, partial [Bdellovibrionota bacterium]